jgi:aspartate aminotransferase
MTFSWKTPPLSPLARSIPASATLAISARAKALKAEGHDVVDLGVGEPDFDTPEHIVEAACKAVREGATHYTPTPGTPQLRKAVAEDMGRTCGIELGPENVIVSPGAKYSLRLAILTVLEPGEKVLIPAPYWVSYPVMVKLAGGTSQVIPTSLETGFKITPELLAEHIDSKCRLLILNSPSNPTGVGYTRDELAALMDVVLKHEHLWVLTDDIYRMLTYGDFKHCPVTSLGTEIASRCIVVDGVSKSYAMTGWRIGFTAGPAELISAMARIQSQATSNPAAVSQAAALAAITGPQDCVEKMRNAFENRRALTISTLSAMEGVTFCEPDGAFYVLADFSPFLGGTDPNTGKKVDTDLALAEYLITSVKVATVPGSAFGAPGCIRMSYAASEERITEGLNRIKKALGNLKK